MRASLLTKNAILVGTTVLAFSTMATASFAQDGGEAVVEPDVVVGDGSAVIDDPAGWVEGEVGVTGEGPEIPAGDGPPLGEEPVLIDEPIEWIGEEPVLIDEPIEWIDQPIEWIGEDVPVYEEYPVIDGEIILVLEPDFTDLDCGGCEVSAMGGGAGAVDLGSSGGHDRISVAPQTIDMCLTEAWKNLWICRIQAVAAQQ